MQGRKSTIGSIGLAIVFILLILTGHFFTHSSSAATPETILDLGRLAMGAGKQDADDPVEVCRRTLAWIGYSQMSYAESNHNRYGTYLDIHHSLPHGLTQAFGNTPYGYSIGWFVNRNKSDFMITATSYDNPNLQEFMIDSRQTVHEIDRVDIDDPADSWTEVLAFEEMARDERGSYAWIDPYTPYSSRDNLWVFMNRYHHTFCIKAIPPGSDGYELIYLSGPGGYFTARPSRDQVNIFAVGRIAVDARGILRAIASSNRAYAGHAGRYGSFEDLQDDLYIAEGYTPETMADGYRFDWFLNEEKDLFAVVAVPTIYPEINPAFLIDQTEVTRELVPVATYSPDANYLEIRLAMESYYDAHDEYTWSPDVELTGYESDIDIYLLPDHDRYLLKIPVIHGEDDLVYVSSLGQFYSTEVFAP
jgi:hypothetical protein